jgi:hypothetical protein
MNSGILGNPEFRNSGLFWIIPPGLPPAEK